jgi:hypothetical protein
MSIYQGTALDGQRTAADRPSSSPGLVDDAKGAGTPADNQPAEAPGKLEQGHHKRIVDALIRFDVWMSDTAHPSGDAEALIAYRMIRAAAIQRVI